MAVLPDAERIIAWAEYMRAVSDVREPVAITKTDLRAAVNAADQWASDNAASFNTALPQPARGALTAALSTEDDAAAQNVLLRFAHATGAPEGASNQAKLEHVARELTEYMISIARERYIQEESAEIAAAALTHVHW